MYDTGFSQIGVNFQPASGAGTAAPGDQPRPANQGVQEAIKVLSLRLPKVVGAHALAPQALLESPGSGGARVDGVIDRIFAKYFPTNAAPSAVQSFGMGPSFDSNQGAQQPRFSAETPYGNPFGDYSGRDRVLDRYIYTTPPAHPVPRFVSGGRTDPNESPADGQSPNFGTPYTPPAPPAPVASARSDRLVPVRDLGMKKTRRQTKKPPKQPLGVYANFVGAQWGLSEVTILLSQMRAEDGEWPKSEVARVSLSPVAAKCLVLELMAAILAFERVHGQIAAVHPRAVQPMPTSRLFTPEIVARLAILRAELFPATVTHADDQPLAGLDDKATKH